jgi:hypothetical protein
VLSAQIPKNLNISEALNKKERFSLLKNKGPVPYFSSKQKGGHKARLFVYPLPLLNSADNLHATAEVLPVELFMKKYLTSTEN